MTRLALRSDLRLSSSKWRSSSFRLANGSLRPLSETLPPSDSLDAGSSATAPARGSSAGTACEFALMARPFSTL
jgi:hypothetical protein